jgi:hypothetical protein
MKNREGLGLPGFFRFYVPIRTPYLLIFRL